MRKTIQEKGGSINHQTRLRDIISSRPYKAVLLDQFGVLHDGVKPYGQFNLDAVASMKDNGIKVFILSNSSRRTTGVITKLERLGYQREWFDGAITSGEVTWKYLSERPGDWPSIGHKCLHCTWSSRGKISLEGLGLEVTQDPHAATFVLAHGTEGLGAHDSSVTLLAPQEIREVLKVAASRNLPFVLANPDFVTVDGDNLAMMPGTLARWYQEDGGKDIRVMGKPGSDIYDLSLKALEMDPCDVLAIGDSLEHDILGASFADINSVFIAGGIASSDLKVKGVGETAAYDKEGVARMCVELNVPFPTYSIPYLTW